MKARLLVATFVAILGVAKALPWRNQLPYFSRKMDRCNIERIPAAEITKARWKQEIWNKKPVIITFEKGADGWTDSKLWSNAALVRRQTK
jgi:hypothetical protein